MTYLCVYTHTHTHTHTPVPGQNVKGVTGAEAAGLGHSHGSTRSELPL